MTLAIEMIKDQQLLVCSPTATSISNSAARDVGVSGAGYEGDAGIARREGVLTRDPLDEFATERRDGQLDGEDPVPRTRMPEEHPGPYRPSRHDEPVRSAFPIGGMKRQWPTACVQKFDGGVSVDLARDGSNIDDLKNGDRLATPVAMDRAGSKREIVPGAIRHRSDPEEQSRQRALLQQRAPASSDGESHVTSVDGHDRPRDHRRVVARSKDQREPFGPGESAAAEARRGQDRPCAIYQPHYPPDDAGRGQGNRGRSHSLEREPRHDLPARPRDTVPARAVDGVNLPGRRPI
jgi:hypothetical protein